jgi:hypothetical protein
MLATPTARETDPMGKIIYGGSKAEYDAGHISLPEDWRKKTADVVAKIGNNDAGRRILNAIGNSDKDLRIAPYDWEAGSCNARTHAEKALDSAPLGISAVSPLPWYKGDDDNIRTTEDERYDLQPKGYVGTGKGSDVTIYFTSDLFDPRNPCDPGDGNVATAADERLFHELIHALRAMNGQMNAVPTEKTARDYDTEEEFLAIVATNVYVSAAGGSFKLRADHHGHLPLRPPLDTSTGFLTDPNNWILLNLHRTGYPAIVLAAVFTAKFNPFRALNDRLGISPYPVFLFGNPSLHPVDGDFMPLGTYPRPD